MRGGTAIFFEKKSAPAGALIRIMLKCIQLLEVVDNTDFK